MDELKFLERALRIGRGESASKSASADARNIRWPTDARGLASGPWERAATAAREVAVAISGELEACGSIEDVDGLGPFMMFIVEMARREGPKNNDVGAASVTQVLVSACALAVGRRWRTTMESVAKETGCSVRRAARAVFPVVCQMDSVVFPFESGDGVDLWALALADVLEKVSERGEESCWGPRLGKDAVGRIRGCVGEFCRVLGDDREKGDGVEKEVQEKVREKVEGGDVGVEVGRGERGYAECIRRLLKLREEEEGEESESEGCLGWAEDLGALWGCLCRVFLAVLMAGPAYDMEGLSKCLEGDVEGVLGFWDVLFGEEAGGIVGGMDFGGRWQEGSVVESLFVDRVFVLWDVWDKLVGEDVVVGDSASMPIRRKFRQGTVGVVFAPLLPVLSRNGEPIASVPCSALVWTAKSIRSHTTWLQEFLRTPQPIEDIKSCPFFAGITLDQPKKQDEDEEESKVIPQLKGTHPCPVLHHHPSPQSTTPPSPPPSQSVTSSESFQSIAASLPRQPIEWDHSDIERAWKSAVESRVPQHEPFRITTKP